MSKFITASEAIAKLRISKRTLYAYVSRGLIRSHRGDGDSRQRLYASTDVDVLTARKRRGRTPAAVARATLNWGFPVLESSISLIERGRLYYRGKDAVALAKDGAALEDIAALLWELRKEELRFRKAAHGSAPSPPTSPIHGAISYLTAQVESGEWSDPAKIAGVLRNVAAGLIGFRPGTDPLHVQLARRWNLTGKSADCLRTALVLCADHELNASTFTVRCVASTGASLSLSVCAGLSALSGPLHGGMTDRAVGLIRAVRGGKYAEALQKNMQTTTVPPGFGHGLYPDGDPRARAVLSPLHYKPVDALVKTAERLDIPPPTIDLALAALEVGLKLPRYAALSIFALGRTVGWIAHALEQRRTGALIRPRAKYTGVMPPSR